MPKPLFRWTVGCCLQQGLDILAESINRTTKSLGIDNWDWLICYNGLTKENVEFLKKAIGTRPIGMFAQNWTDCPVDDNMQSPRRFDGSYEWDGRKCGGTMWKACPPRVRQEAHEIVMDNDIILLKKFPQIDEFLAQKDHALILEEPIRFYGRYDHLFPPGKDGPFLNSGFMGFPPGYDYAAAIRKVWEDNGRFTSISQADEQALLTYTLNGLPSVRVKKSQMYEFLAKDYAGKITGHEEGIHFTQGNRIPNHRGWLQYQKLHERSVI